MGRTREIAFSIAWLSEIDIKSKGTWNFTSLKHVLSLCIQILGALRGRLMTGLDILVWKLFSILLKYILVRYISVEPELCQHINWEWPKVLFSFLFLKVRNVVVARRPRTFRFTSAGTLHVFWKLFCVSINKDWNGAPSSIVSFGLTWLIGNSFLELVTYKGERAMLTVSLDVFFLGPVWCISKLRLWDRQKCSISNLVLGSLVLLQFCRCWVLHRNKWFLMHVNYQ